jgi:hypothetical protein
MDSSVYSICTSYSTIHAYADSRLILTQEKLLNVIIHNDRWKFKLRNGSDDDGQSAWSLQGGGRDRSPVGLTKRGVFLVVGNMMT